MKFMENNGNPAGTKKYWRTTIVVLAVLAVLLFAPLAVRLLSYYFSNYISHYLSRYYFVEKWESDGSGASFDVSGKIYLTLREGEGFLRKEDISAVGVYEFDAASGNLSRFLNGGGNLNIDFSPDGTESVFLSLKKDNDDGKLTTQIFKRDINGAVKQLTSSDTYKELPRLSPDKNLVVYTIFTGTKGNDLIVPEQRSVYAVGFDGKEKFVTKGDQPLFLPDGKIVVLKNSGIYVVDVDNNKEWLGIPFNKYGTDRTMKLGLSKKGDMLAVSIYDDGKVIVFKIGDWGESSFSYYTYKTIPISGFWPVFSPDGRYLAVQEVKLTNVSSPSNPRLVVYDLKTLDWKSLINLNDYEQKTMWLTDWLSQ